MRHIRDPANGSSRTSRIDIRFLGVQRANVCVMTKRSANSPALSNGQQVLLTVRLSVICGI